MKRFTPRECRLFNERKQLRVEDDLRTVRRVSAVRINDFYTLSLDIQYLYEGLYNTLYREEEPIQKKNVCLKLSILKTDFSTHI